MTRDEIIKLAREAGFAINTRTGDINASHGSYSWIISRELERFAALVAAAEREACAAICEHYDSWGAIPRQAAEAIRERGFK